VRSVPETNLKPSSYQSAKRILDEHLSIAAKEGTNPQTYEKILGHQIIPEEKQE